MTKTNTRSRIVSILLVLMMLLTMVPITAVTANAADGFVEVSTYEELRSKVNKGSAKIKLMANIDTTNENGGAGLTSTTNLTFKGGGHVLDLNGHTLKLVTSVKDTHLIAVESQDLTIKDSSSSGSGRIEMEFGENLTNIQYPIYISGMGSLTIDGGTFSSSFNFVNYIECYGSLTINGGTIVSNSKRQVNLIKCEDANLTINGGKLQIPDKNELGMSYGYAVYTENRFGDDRQIVITGGEIDGKVAFTRNDSSATGTPKYNKLPVKITGGVFKQKVYAYYSQKPSGEITEFSPAVELAGGTFKDVYNENLASSNGLATKLTAGTFEKSANIVTHVSDTAMAGYRACLGNSVILKGNECRTAYDWSSMQGFEVSPTGMYFIFREAVVIPNAWGMKSVTLDGTEINYAKDWKGTVENLTNDKAHTLKFEWYPLAQELKDAGYSYRTKCEHYISGSTAVQKTENIDANATSHTITIPAGADPKVYSYDLHLNLNKNGSSVGIISNEHIVKLVVNEAPVVTEISNAPVQLSAALTPGTSAPGATAVGSGYTVDSINWYTDNNCTKLASSFEAGKAYYGKIVLKSAENYKFAASASALIFCDDPNENYSIVGSSTVAEDGSSLTLIVKGKAVSALKWETVNTDDKAYTIGDSALTLNAKAVGGESSKPITYKLIAKKDGTETVKASATVAASSTNAFSASLRFTDTGSYECWFEATRGNVTITSDHFTVTVNAPGLSIANQSGDLTVKQNATARLFVKAVGHGVNYQWQVKNGGAWKAISGETAYDYAAPTTNVGEKTYRCKVTDKYGATKYTNEMTVTVTAVADSSLTPAIPLAAVNGDAPDPAELWPDKDVTPNGWLGLKAEYNVTAGETFHGVATFSTIPTGFNMNGHDIYFDSYNNIQKTPVLGTISYEWEGTTKNPWEAADSDFSSLGTDAHASFTIPSGVNTYYVVLSVKNTVGTQAAISTVYITFHVSAAHTHTYAYAQLNESQHTKYCTAGDASTQETHTMENGVCKYCGYAPAKTYSVTVTNGSANHSTNVTPGTKVTLTADTAPSGQEFDKWLGNVTVASDNTFTMPSHNVTVAATYKPIAHTHDTDAQPWVYMDPGTHIKTCTAGDDFKVEAHDFSAWTKVDESTHSRTCSKCKKSGEATNYTETAEHTWVWVVDQEAALGQPGKQHEECTGCHTKRSENTEIPALRDYAVTVTGGTATVAAGTPITRAMEGVEVTVTAQAPDGTHFVKWVVKAGGVTLANETSATTTFIMPANDVTIEAEFAENPVEAYTLTVIKGTASVAAGTPITDKIEQNTVVTVTADAPETGKVFDKWVVLEGNVTLADATKATTTFTMPGNDVKLEATYKDAPPSHTHSYGTDWKYDDTNHWHECSCGDKADLAAHSFQWVIDKAATKEATGSRHEECTVCGAKRSENTVIDKLPDGGNTGSGDNNTNKPGKDDSTKSPQTGDSSNLIGWLAALFVSGGVLTVLGLNGKKRKESEAE